MRKIAEERDKPVEPVDMNIVQELSDIRPVFTPLSWIWALFVVAVLAFGIALHPAMLIIYGYPASGPALVVAAFGLGLLPIVVFARTSIPDRDEVMADNIEQVLESQDDIEKACLVVGHKHADGVEEELRDRGFEVCDPFKSKWLRRSL